MLIHACHANAPLTHDISSTTATFSSVAAGSHWLDSASLAFFVYLDLATLSFTEILVVLQTRHYYMDKAVS